MLSEDQLTEILARVPHTEDQVALRSEIYLLRDNVTLLTQHLNKGLAQIEADMERLDQENARLRAVARSTYFERDACVGLIGQLAQALGLPAGTCRAQIEAELQNRVIVDLPVGQVSWEYLDEDGHLFSNLPEYSQPVEAQSIQENYKRVMNSGVGQS
jgi:hypothetical protein